MEVASVCSLFRYSVVSIMSEVPNKSANLVAANADPHASGVRWLAAACTQEVSNPLSVGVEPSHKCIKLGVATR